MRSLVYTVSTALLTLLTGCVSFGGGLGESGVNHTYGFEQGLDAWTARALDTEVGGEEIDWSVSASADIASEGSQSARFSVDNRTDAAKVWLEHSYSLKPNREYDVDISFDFGTGDFGDFNLWTIIAGARSDSPQSTDDLPYTEDNTGGSTQEGSYIWLPKHYSSRVRSNAAGELFVIVGVWGTWETLRQYYIDRLHIQITPVQN